MASETLWGSTIMVFPCHFDQFWSPKLVQKLKKNEATKTHRCPSKISRIFLNSGTLFGGILWSGGKAKMSFSSRQNTSFHIFSLSETRPKNMWRTSTKKVSFLMDFGVSFQRFFIKQRVWKSCFTVAAIWALGIEDK